MDYSSVKIKKSTYDRINAMCEEHKLKFIDIIDIASLALSSGIINIDAVKEYKDQIINKTIEAALKKTQSVKAAKEPEVAGCSYDKTGWPPRPIEVHQYSVMREDQK